MTFTAGDTARAPLLRDSLPSGGLVVGDVSAVSTTVLADVPGLAFSMDRNSVYLFELYLAYTANVDGGLKLAFSGPPDCTPRWSLYGQDITATGSVGDIRAYRFSAFGDATFTVAGGSGSHSGAMMLPAHGTVFTQRFAGLMQVRFAQFTSDTGATTVRAGSWIRATKVM